jgi:hypothetical protein
MLRGCIKFKTHAGVGLAGAGKPGYVLYCMGHHLADAVKDPMLVDTTFVTAVYRFAPWGSTPFMPWEHSIQLRSCGDTARSLLSLTA